MCIATGYRGQETWQRGWSKAFGMGLLQEEATSPSHITSYVRKRKLQEIHKHRKLYAPQTQRPLSSSLAAIKLPLLLLLLLLSRFSRVWLCAPHRRQSTRLLCPWDSPGKNTGVGCHFLLQCMKVKSESEVAQSCPTLSDPMDRSLPGSSVHEKCPWIWHLRLAPAWQVKLFLMGRKGLGVQFCPWATRGHTWLPSHQRRRKGRICIIAMWSGWVFRVVSGWLEALLVLFCGGGEKGRWPVKDLVIYIVT